MENDLSEQEKFFQELSIEIKEKFITFLSDIINNKIFNSKIFNQENITKTQLNKIIEVIINKNTIKTFKGDISTNSLIKFYHFIINSNIEEKEKEDFILNFEKKFEIYLNDKNENKNINKYQINFHYINIFLIDKKLLENKKEDETDKNNLSKGNNDTFTFNSIGTLISCFPEKFSSPRQGNLLELTRGKIVLKKNIDLHCFDGIENFTYIWIVYVFHLNQGFAGSKVIPPKYPGKDNNKKLGIFATRTPHRYNPIGLTLCKFDKIKNREIFISCVDMITGTPILDIKPYHHLESVDVFAPNIKYAQWIYDSCKAEKCSVIIKDKAIKNIEDILKEKKLMFYDKKEDLIKLIQGVLEIDPHSKYTHKQEGNLLYGFHVDKLNVIYQYNAQSQKVIVEEVQYSEEYIKLRNKKWTEEYSKTHINNNDNNEILVDNDNDNENNINKISEDKKEDEKLK